MSDKLSATSLVQTTSSRAANPTPGTPNVPGFEIIGEIGRGGMGIVYLARQIALNRSVALKMIIEGVRIHESDRLRFLAEAEAVAAIKHENVVQVYECGQTSGLPYFAMEYVGGGSLAKTLDDQGPLRPKIAASLIARVARGVQAAHDIGVVHRDLKPANILLQSASQEAKSKRAKKDGPSQVAPNPAPLGPIPKVTDFGIAKRGGGVELTLTGMVMGTPAYMAPEQAAGQAKFVGPAADIYALGVILFQCLSGETPFTGDNSQSLLLQVVQGDVPALSSVVPNIPRDLDLICSKCLAKHPHKRYPSAEALAADLDHFAAGEPVSVRPPGRMEKAVRWVRKYPTWAAVYGLTLVATILLLLTGGAFALWRGAEKARSQAETAMVEAEDARRAALLALEGQASAQRALETADAARDTDFAYREYESNNIEYARNILALVPPDLRTWEWNYVARMTKREAWVGNISGGQLVGIGYAENGDLIAGGSRGVWKWDAANGNPSCLTPQSVAYLAVSGNGKRAAVGLSGDQSKTIILELPEGKQIREIAGPSRSAAFNYSGENLLLVQATGITIVDLSTFKEASVKVQDLSPAQQPAVDPHGFAFAVGCAYTGEGRKTGYLQLFSRGGERIPGPFLVGTKSATAMTFGPNRPLLATGSDDGELVVFDLDKGGPIAPPVSLSGRINALAFSPDCQWLAIAGEDRVVRVWHVHTSGLIEVFTFKGHSGPVTGLAFNHSGTHLATSSIDGSARIWELTDIPDAIRLEINGTLTSIAALTGGKQVTASTNDGASGTYDLLTGKLLPAEASMADSTATTVRNQDRLVVSPDGQWIIAGGRDRVVRILEVSTRKELLTLIGHNAEVTAAAVSLDRARIATASRDGVVKVWDSKTGRVRLSFPSRQVEVSALSWTPDGTKLIAGSQAGVAQVFDGSQVQGW